MRPSPYQLAAVVIITMLMVGIGYVGWNQFTTTSPHLESFPTREEHSGNTHLGALPTPEDKAPSAGSSPWLSAVQPSAGAALSPLPATLELTLLNASLSALQSNGANLSATMRSRHVVQVTDPRTADELMRWGRQQGFAMSFDRFYLHGGIEAQMLYFDRHMVPNALRIQQDGLAILGALSGMDTAEYGTWVGEINRS